MGGQNRARARRLEAHLVQRRPLQQVEECPLVVVDQVEVRPVLQQRLDHPRLGRLVAGGGVQGSVAVLVITDSY